MKECTRCLRTLPVSAFSFKNKRLGSVQAACKECVRPLIRAHYARNASKYAARNKRHRKERVQAVRQMKSVPCADCNVSYPYYVMDFDHRDKREKDHLMARATWMASMGTVLREAKKCDIVCANCHRERTYGPSARQSIDRHKFSPK